MAQGFKQGIDGSETLPPCWRVRAPWLGDGIDARQIAPPASIVEGLDGLLVTG